jgi:hypothetical protein
LAGIDAQVNRLNAAYLGADRAPRPANGVLRSERVVPLPPWREQLGTWWETVACRA